MKLATFSVDDRTELGIVTAEGMIPINRLDTELPNQMSALLGQMDKVSKRLETLITECVSPLSLDDITLHAPIEKPGKFLAIGLNYQKHRAEAVDAGITVPRNQMWFTKQASSITGPFGKVLKPTTCLMFDYEVELAVVIGRRCKQVSAADAHRFIGGYTIANDLSMRDWQLHNMPERLELMIGKSFDTHGPFGPWIVTPDEIEDPHALGIRCIVNGEMRQSSNTDDMIWNCFQQIEYLSQAMTLHPGDVLLTGTPPGSGFSPPNCSRSGWKKPKSQRVPRSW